MGIMLTYERSMATKFNVSSVLAWARPERRGRGAPRGRVVKSSYPRRGPRQVLTLPVSRVKPFTATAYAERGGRDVPPDVHPVLVGIPALRTTDWALPVLWAADCPPCPDCGEPWCDECQDHYADCHHPGPMSEPEEVN